MEKIRCKKYGNFIEFEVAIQYYIKDPVCVPCINGDKCREAREQIEIDKDNMPCEHLIDEKCKLDGLFGCNPWARWDLENAQLDSNDFCKLSKLERDKFN